MIDDKHYSVVFQALPMPCLVLLPNVPDFTIINASDAYAEVTHTTRDELIGKGFFEVFPNNPYQSGTIWKNIFDEVIREKKSCSVPPQRYAFPTTDVPARLDVKYLTAANTPVLDADGEIKYIIRSMMDVTDTIYHQRFLEETQRTARIGSWEVNIAHRTVTWSEGLREIYEVGPDYEPGFKVPVDFYPDVSAHKTFEEAFLKAIQDGTVFRLTLPMVTAKGKERWLSIVGKADLVGGTCVRVYGISQDITEAKLAELALKNMHTQLEGHLKEVEESEKKYSDLFHLSPQPMWVYDLETYAFLDVNVAAINHYGYTRDEFLSMTIMDVRPPEEIPKVEAVVAFSRQHDELFSKGSFKHRKKNGEIIHVEVQRNIIKFRGRKAEVLLIHDITEKLYYIEAIEAQNKKLQEIAWMQSHMVRAPLARIMGLVDLLQHVPDSGLENNELLGAIYGSAIELDDILRSITQKAEQINLTNK